MTANTLTHRGFATVRRPATRGLRALLAIVAAWRRRVRERRELMWLSDRELNDFGASRTDAIAEANKPFWRG